jgi:hypothetical protein
MTEHEALVVRPWKRYGKDRSYVGTASGSTLGYRDNETGLVHVEDEAFRPAVLAALGEPSIPQQSVTSPVPDYAVTVERWADDLAANAPGQGAQERARELRSQAPVKTFLARVLGVHTDERAWRVGAEGERIVGAELEQLEARGWQVLHDVPVGERGANIDHVLVGPGGVWTVNTKYHWGGRVWASGNTVKVNGRFEPYVAKASHEATRASRLLSAAVGRPVVVRGIVAIVCDQRQVVRQPKSGQVLVLGPREAKAFLAGLPAVLAIHEVDGIAAHARRSTTWVP